jgi:excisionase family DNA binding protein
MALGNSGKLSVRHGGAPKMKRIEESTPNIPLAHNLEDSARLLAVSVSFLRLEMTRGRLRAAKLGRRILIPHDELVRYLERGTVSQSR